MSNLKELVDKAAYIVSKKKHLNAQFHAYQNSLIQALSGAKSHLNHDIVVNEARDIRFLLFNHFTVSIQLDEGFYSRTISYRFNTAPATSEPIFVTFAQATLSEEGYLNESVDIRNKHEVLEHYLNNVAIIFQSLFDAIQNNQPIQSHLENVFRKNSISTNECAE